MFGPSSKKKIPSPTAQPLALTLKICTTQYFREAFKNSLILRGCNCEGAYNVVSMTPLLFTGGQTTRC